MFKHDRDFSCESTQLPSHRLGSEPAKRDVPPALPGACPAQQGRPGRQRTPNFITICFWPTPVPESIFAHFLKAKAKQLLSAYNHSWKQRPVPTCVFIMVSLLSFPLSRRLLHCPVARSLKWKRPWDRSRITAYVRRTPRSSELHCNDSA